MYICVNVYTYMFIKIPYLTFEFRWSIATGSLAVTAVPNQMYSIRTQSVDPCLQCKYLILWKVSAIVCSVIAIVFFNQSLFDLLRLVYSSCGRFN